MKLLHSREKETAETAEKFRLPLSAYLSYLLVATLLFTGVSFSKFASAASESETAYIAEFSVDAAADTSNITMNCKSAITPGTGSGSFTVIGRSEVTATYDVVITLDEPLSEDVKIMLVKEDNTTCTLTRCGNIFTAKNVCTIAADKRQEEKFELRFEEQTSNTFAAHTAMISKPADTYPTDYNWTPTEKVTNTYNFTVKICASQVD